MRPLILISTALLLLAAAPPPPPPGPALWKVSDPDTTIYLFGTVHALPAGDPWLSGPVAEAFGKADTLVLEIALAKDADQALAATMRKWGMATGLPPLLQRVPPRKRAALAAMIGQLGLSPQALGQYKTWLAVLTISSLQALRQGFDPSRGAEQMLSAGARERKVAVLGLETADEQLSFFDGVPEKDQRAMLVQLVDDMPKANAELAELLAAWRAGDQQKLARLATEDLAATPRLKAVLLDQRNARWARWIERRLDTPGTVFLAVGAGHLTGNAGVQALLARDKVRVERLR